MELSNHQLKTIIRAAAEMGAKIALEKVGRLKPYLKKSEAFRLYGRRKIEHWIEEGMITPRKDGNHSATWRIERIEVEAIVKAMELSLLI
jgi:hypothetical protein